MICPQCATRNELGSQRCQTCGQPFTHDAYRAGAPAGRRSRARRPEGLRPQGRQPVAAASASTPAWGPDQRARTTGPAGEGEDTSVWSAQAVSRREPGKRRRPHGCLIAVGGFSVLIVGLLVAALLASNYVVKPMVRDAAVEDLRVGVRDEVSTQIATQIADAPEGEIIITDDEINQRLADGGDLGPIDEVTITITPEVITVDLRAYGLTGSYQSVIRAENGSVVLDNGTLDGPLGFVIPDNELAEATNIEIAAALSEAGYRVESATMQDGAIALSVVR